MVSTAIASGETPVGMPKYTYGAEANGVMPWLQDRFDPSRTTLLELALLVADGSCSAERKGGAVESENGCAYGPTS